MKGPFGQVNRFPKERKPLTEQLRANFLVKVEIKCNKVVRCG